MNLRKETTLIPDNFIYSCIILAFLGFTLFNSENFGTSLHGRATISGFGSELGSALVDMFLNSSWIENAYKVFGGISEPNMVLWNTVIYGLVKNCSYDEAIRVFLNMVNRTMRFDSTTLVMVLSAIAELQEMSFGMMVQSLAIKVGCHFHEHVLTCLISLYSKCGDTLLAPILFELLGKSDLIAYYAMISGYSCNN